jgi:hypothetical protein
MCLDKRVHEIAEMVPAPRTRAVLNQANPATRAVSTVQKTVDLLGEVGARWLRFTVAVAPLEDLLQVPREPHVAARAVEILSPPCVSYLEAAATLRTIHRPLRPPRSLAERVPSGDTLQARRPESEVGSARCPEPVQQLDPGAPKYHPLSLPQGSTQTRLCRRWAPPRSSRIGKEK